MTIQLDLFRDQKRKHQPPIARTSDPQTSHDAANGVQLSETKQRCLAVLVGEKTASEIGRDATAKGGNAETHRKRVGELHRDGLIVACGTRVCTVTGINATVFRRAGT